MGKFLLHHQSINKEQEIVLIIIIRYLIKTEKNTLKLQQTYLINIDKLKIFFLHHLIIDLQTKNQIYIKLTLHLQSLSPKFYSINSNKEILVTYDDICLKIIPSLLHNSVNPLNFEYLEKFKVIFNCDTNSQYNKSIL